MELFKVGKRQISEIVPISFKVKRGAKKKMMQGTVFGSSRNENGDFP